MRDAFFLELTDLFKRDQRVFFLTGDLGYKLFDPLREIDPARVINVGIREAAMVGTAAGLARAGKLPFVYSIVPFMTLRCLEQIKIDLCYNVSRVVVVGVGGGFSYGHNGPTHHGVDDIGVMSCLPRMTVWTPGDPCEVRSCVRAAVSLTGPAYLRLGRNREKTLHDPHKGLPDISKPQVLAGGDDHDGIIVSCGFVVQEVLEAAKMLHAKGMRPRIVHLATMRPFPRKELQTLIGRGKPVLTVEEHVTTGGLGQEVAAFIAGEMRRGPFGMLSAPHEFCGVCGDRNYLLKWSGIDARSIAERYEQLLRKGGADVNR